MIAVLATTARAQGKPAQRARLNGSVLAEGPERPVSGAEIAVAYLGLVVRSDSTGAFVIPEIAAGVYQVTVRAVGYEPFAARVAFAVGEAVERDFLLRASPNVLAQVDVTASVLSRPSPRLLGFEERRKLGLGRFFTQEAFERAEGRKLADVFSGRLPGVRVVANRGERYLATASRGNISMIHTPGDVSSKRECYVQVVIDNIIRYRSVAGERPFNIDSVDPSTVAAAEYYSVSQTPLQYQATGSSACGTLLLWTRT